VSEDAFSKLRDQVEGLVEQEGFSPVARWFFADRTARKVSPFQTAAVAEYVQRRIEENIRTGLEHVIRLDPANSIALGRLAKAILHDDTSPEGKADASNLARLALRFNPNQSDAREVLARMVSDNSTAK
jgi:hypothetical protein